MAASWTVGDWVGLFVGDKVDLVGDIDGAGDGDQVGNGVGSCDGC